MYRVGQKNASLHSVCSLAQSEQWDSVLNEDCILLNSRDARDNAIRGESPHSPALTRITFISPASIVQNGRERERQSGANRTTIESPLVHWIWFQSDRYYLVSCSMYSCDKSEIDGILVQISIFLIMWSDNNTFILAIIKILVFFELQSINPLFKRGQRGDTVTGLNCELTFFFFPRCPRKT